MKMIKCSCLATLLALCSSFVLPASSIGASKTSCAANNDDEMNSLRKENERLKLELDSFRGESPFDLFPFFRRPRELLAGEDGVSLARKTFDDMFSKVFRDDDAVKTDVDLVLHEAAKDIENELGTGVVYDTPIQRSYSSQSINGKTTKKIALALHAQTSQKSAIVALHASIGEDSKVIIDDLKFDDVRKVQDTTAAAESPAEHQESVGA